MNKENKLTEVRDEFIKELERWKRTRKWEADIPSDKDEDSVQTLSCPI